MAPTVKDHGPPLWLVETAGGGLQSLSTFGNSHFVLHLFRRPAALGHCVVETLHGGGEFPVVTRRRVVHDGERRAQQDQTLWSLSVPK